MAKLMGPFTLPDEHHAAIGRVADAWAHLEFILDRAIWHLADTHDQLAACITAQLISVHPRMRALIALFQVRGGKPETVAELNRFYGEIGPMSERRNRCIHDPRMKQKETGVVGRFEITAKPRVHFDMVPETVEDLDKFHMEIYDAIQRLQALLGKAISEIQALRPEDQPILKKIQNLPKAPEDQTTVA